MKAYLTIVKPFFLYLMAAAYIASGLNHFFNPKIYLKIMPPWLPWPQFLVAFTGVLEILLGLLLIPELTRRPAAWGLIILLILIFPANVQMMLNYWRAGNPYTWIAVLRLPVQALLIWWAWMYTK
ncbi:MAG TPA: DoxX family membrane protein [Flavisolibacter sp.]|nr:DoxX family membrane protein [Flavisolibacter sp.]